VNLQRRLRDDERQMVLASDPTDIGRAVLENDFWAVVLRFWHPLWGCILVLDVYPVDFAALRPPATIWQPSGLREELPGMLAEQFVLDTRMGGYISYGGFRRCDIIYCLIVELIRRSG